MKLILDRYNDQQFLEGRQPIINNLIIWRKEMTCKKCSFEFSDDFAFCPKCGTKVEVKDEISLPGASEGIMEIEDSDSSIGDFIIENGILRKYMGNDKNIKIPDSVTEIYAYAFHGCSSLTSVSIPDSVTEIGLYAFDDCSSLSGISIPNSVTYIGKKAFNHCKINNLEYRNLLKIKNGLALSDDESEVLYCTNSSLTSVSIPDSVTEIGDSAFFCCSSLTSVSIPDSVTEIGEDAFYDCKIDNLEYRDLLKIKNGLALSDDETRVLYCANSSLTSISIPDSVTEICEGAFASCSNLTSVSIPDSVTEIGDSAFFGCSSLTNVSIPDSVTEIGYNAFRDCSSLTSVSIPDSVTEIGSSAFASCSSLTEVIFKGTKKEWKKIKKIEDFGNDIKVKFEK